MGGGSSLLEINQENFVEKHYNSYKKQLPNYSEMQIKNKLRQLYHHTDKDNENKNSYILDKDWNKCNFLKV